MGYKVTSTVLEGLKKQLEASNRALIRLTPVPKAEINKLIKANEKQIKLLKDEFYID